LTDPESNYLTPTIWGGMGPFHRLVRRALTTLAGRLIIGPLYVVWRAARYLQVAIRVGDRSYLARWLHHLPAAAVVLVWVLAVCHIPLWQYLLLYVYPGLSLTLLRSYAEHRAALAVGERIATVRANPVMAFLYTFNNFHAPITPSRRPLVPPAGPLPPRARPSSTRPTALHHRRLWRALSPLSPHRQGSPGTSLRRPGISAVG
jgi:hypothetical protein